VGHGGSLLFVLAALAVLQRCGGCCDYPVAAASVIAA